MSAIVDHNGNAFRRVGGAMPTPYEAGGQGRRLRGWLASGSGPNDAATGNAQTLRNRSRQQYRNNGYAQSGINKLVSNIIGTGIKPRSTADDKAFQREAQLAFEEWGQECDPEGVLGIYGLQAQACNAWLQGGECFIRRRPRRESDGLSVPLQLQVMEAEMCPVHYSMQGNNGNRIRHGIQYNKLGQRVAYWFYKSHPGDITAGLSVDGSMLTRVPARDVIHLFDPVRPGQSRGIIKMAPVLLPMYDVDKSDDAAVLKQQVQNLFTGFAYEDLAGSDTFPHRLAQDQGELPGPGEAYDEGEQSGPVDISMEPGSIVGLAPGEKISFSSPPDAGSTYGEFLKWQFHRHAAGMEVPYEVLTGDFSKINDRLARVILNDFHRRVQQQQQHIVVHQACRVIWAHWFMPAGIQVGRLSAPGFAANPRAFTRANHVPQAWRYINPVQDVQADREAVRSGFRTQGDIINERTGEDIDDVHKRWADEAEQSDELGLRFDSDPRWTDNSGKRLDGAKLQEAEREEDANA
ncbi:phage portal protein [Salinisphaera sp. T31B1]|uniref:phage portal protein n=1 Tax=Salinisphaera sp. T31B1 TaxID=727963 RepID=UPI0033428BFF